MNHVQKKFPEFMVTTEKIVGRTIKVKVVDEDLKVSWGFDQFAIQFGRKYCQKVDETRLLQDILFELQNAQYSKIFQSYFDRIPMLDMKTFVELVEWTEWRTTEKTVERLQKAGIPDEKIYLSQSYYEFFELYYLQQQLEGHPQTIAERYLIHGGEKTSTYQVTWKVPFVLRSQAHRILKELIANHLDLIRTGKGEEDLQSKIEILELGSNRDLDLTACKEALANYKWFTEKYQSLVEGNQS